MKRKLANRYTYKMHYRYDEDKKQVIEWLGDVYADRGRRLYKTKWKPSDLPEYYCDVQRYCSSHDILTAKGVKDVLYNWLKVNHFMKDSVLHISYTGKLEPYHEQFMFDGKKITSCFTSYTNEDGMVFGHDIFKYLAYAKKYSGISLSKARKAFIEQCEWLKANEPMFAPHEGHFHDGNVSFPDFGKWFDKQIEEYENYSNK